MAKAVVFDFDGTLLDTEPVHDEALLRILSKAGVRTSIEELLKCSGAGVKATMDYFKARNAGREVDWEGVAREFSDSLLPSTLASPAFEGAAETVKSLAEKFPLAIASNSLKQAVRAGLEKNRLLEFFPTIVAREDFGNAKPHPEPFLKACAGLGFAPGECAAVEDSPAGIASALAAGCKTIAFTARNPLEKEAKQKVSYATSSLPDITPQLIYRL